MSINECFEKADETLVDDQIRKPITTSFWTPHGAQIRNSVWLAVTNSVWASVLNSECKSVSEPNSIQLNSIWGQV